MPKCVILQYSQYLKAHLFLTGITNYKLPLLYRLYHVFKYLQLCHSLNVDN